MPNLNNLSAQDVIWGSQNWSGMRNLLINALGQINQRGYISGTATTSANQYTVDRWKVLVSGQNVSWTTTNGIATFTAPAGGFAQVIEGANIQGGNYVMSWTGMATATVNGTAVANGVPFNLAANANATVVFSNGTFSMPQLELGALPTRFDWRLFGIELALCKRYFEKSYNTGVSPGTATTAGSLRTHTDGLTSYTHQAIFSCSYKEVKRSAPALTFYSPNTGAAGYMYDVWNNNDISANATYAGLSAFSVYATSTVASTTCDFAVHWTADAEL